MHPFFVLDQEQLFLFFFVCFFNQWPLPASLSIQVDTDIIHVIKWTRPSLSVFAYWKMGQWEGLGTRLLSTYTHSYAVYRFWIYFYWEGGSGKVVLPYSGIIWQALNFAKWPKRLIFDIGIFLIWQHVSLCIEQLIEVLYSVLASKPGDNREDENICTAERCVWGHHVCKESLQNLLHTIVSLVNESPAQYLYII